MACLGIIVGSVFAGREKDTLKIATKPMTEQYILGEMLDIMIEQDTNMKVEVTQGRWRRHVQYPAGGWKKESSIVYPGIYRDRMEYGAEKTTV